LRDVTAQRLSLHKPHKVDGDKKQPNEGHASNNVRLHRSKRSFFHEFELLGNFCCLLTYAISAVMDEALAWGEALGLE
jgi:hypothetical protein